MILSHKGESPLIDPSVWVAPTATICGNVVLGKNVRIAHGARVIAADRQINIGEQTIILENAVVRSTTRQPTKIGKFCLIGPNAHLVGCEVEDEVFIATGAAIFHDAFLAKGSEVRVHATVHLRTRLAAGDTVPIGWVAVGDPARKLPPDQHDEIWQIQKDLNFTEAAYGLKREIADMRAITKEMATRLGYHSDDEEISDKPLAVGK